MCAQDNKHTQIEDDAEPTKLHDSFPCCGGFDADEPSICGGEVQQGCQHRYDFVRCHSRNAETIRCAAGDGADRCTGATSRTDYEKQGYDASPNDDDDVNK